MRAKQFCLIFLLSTLIFSSCAPQPTPILRTVPTKQILLVFGRDNNLLVVDPMQGNVTQTIPLPIPSGCVVWSLNPAPRGRWFAVELDCANHPLVETFNVDSGESNLITPIKDSDSQFITWNSAGDALYVKAAPLDSPRIARVEVATNTAQFLPLSPYVYDLAVSADDAHMAYSFAYGIGYGSATYLADAMGRQPRLLISDRDHINTFLRWSPHGEAIAFIRMEDSQIPFTVGQLVVSDLSGAKIQELGEADAGHGFAPAWSPDGTQIAFVKRENAADSRADSESSALIANILVADVSTSATHPISSFTDSQTSAPAWSADGQFVAYTVTSKSKITLWVNNQKLLDQVFCCAAWLAER